MNIHNAIGKSLDEGRREQAHIAGQADKVDSGLPQCRNHLGIVLLANAPFGGNQQRVQPTPPRRLQSRCFRAVRDHYGDFRLQPARLDGIGNGFEIRASPGKKEAKFFERRHIYLYHLECGIRNRQSPQDADSCLNATLLDHEVKLR
jgi:hypothetical protein